jgi:hypothetical protein
MFKIGIASPAEVIALFGRLVFLIASSKNQTEFIEVPCDDVDA